jgi:hypothetical protein
MPNKVRQFKQPTSGSAKMPTAPPMILFKFGERRFLIQWIITELPAVPAEVIPIQKKRKVRDAALT